jgi:hypothetical protein
VLRPSQSRVCATLALSLCANLAPVACASEPASPGERPAAVAGRFYPGSADKLEAAIRAFLETAVPPRGERPIALVAPHAGYLFSGQIAADAYRQAMGHEFDIVVILGTNHTRAGFGGVSVHGGSGYRTPLGLAKIDQRLASALRAMDEAFTFDPAVHAREHSVEVHVPFVQVAFPGVEILPAVIGAPEPDLCRRLGLALASLLDGRQALIVASSDLSHFPAYEDAVAADSAVLKAITGLDPAAVRAAIRDQLSRGRKGLSTCACGEGPILTALTAAKALGATRGIVISYANSGDAAVGERSRVVGYGAVALFGGDGPGDVSALERPQPPAAHRPLGQAEKHSLLAFARETIRRMLTTETAPLARGFPPALGRKQGAFVTLKRKGQLRGCIGHMAEDQPLYRVVGAMALQAAFNDRRFAPIAEHELSEIDVEVSVLTPRRRVAGPAAVVLGRDGVGLQKAGRSAVFLPQVPGEQGWDVDQTLEGLCRKAGLPQGCWRDGAELYTFQADVFHEG